MQLGLLEACVQGRLCCTPNLTTTSSSLRLRYVAGSSPVAQLVRRPANKIDVAAARALSSSASLFSRLSIRGGLPVLPKSRNGGFRVEASGAYSKESFVSEGEANKLAQVSKRLERTAGYFKRLGQLGFWGQLVCTVVAAVILAFSIVITGQATAPVSTYLTAGGIAAAFLSVFWSFGYIRLSQRLRDAINDPTKAPPRAEVVKNLKNGIVINLLGLGSSLLGLQATVGVLVAKALTSSTTPYLQGAPQGFSPVLALDVFLVQASGNALLAHFLGIVFALELLRSVTVSQPPPDSVIPKAA